MTNPNLPFMTAVAGHVIIHDDGTGAPLPETWTGLCVDGANSQAFWVIGHEAGERTFVKLQATERAVAEQEALQVVFRQWESLVTVELLKMGLSVSSTLELLDEHAELLLTDHIRGHHPRHAASSVIEANASASRAHQAQRA